jgi:O-antigen ligase
MTRRSRRTSAPTGSLVLPAALALLVWGTLAFGAVYSWAFRPLALGAAVVGAGALVQAARRSRLGGDDGLLLAGVVLVIAGAVAQTIPLPASLRTTISPASEAFFRTYDPAYRLASAAREGTVPLVGGLAPDQVPMRPLSLDRAATWRGLGLLGAFTLLLAGLTRTLSRTGVTRFAGWIVAFGAVVALIGIVQKAVLGDHAYGGMRIYGFWEPINKLTTPFGPFVNKNHFAGWMLIVLPLGIGQLAGLAGRGLVAGAGWRDRVLWLSSESGGRAQLTALAVGLMAVSLVMTLSRSGMASFAIAVTAMALLGGRTMKTARARLGVAAGLVGLILVIWLGAGVNLSSRFGTVPDAVALRLHAWRDALSIVRDFPLTGTGLNTYATATLKYQTGERVLHFREAHNDYLQLAAEGGVLLGVPALMALVALVVLIVRRARAGGSDSYSDWTRLGAAAGLLAIALQSLVEFSLQMPGNALLCVLVMSMAIAARRVSPGGNAAGARLENGMGPAAVTIVE